MTQTLSEKAGGYVTEIPYASVYHRELSPSLQALALHNRGVAGPDRAGAYTYIELGCGVGLTTLIHAAGNPHGRFLGVDINPEHIAIGKRIAEGAGLKNIEFIECGFEDLTARDLPPVDVIAMHGVWTWINDANRQYIVNFAKAKLKPGGVLYLNYNALPGQAAVQPMRKLMWEGFNQATGSLLDKVGAGLAYAEKVKAANGAYFAMNPIAVQHLEHLKQQTRDYLAHEYFGADWWPLYHGQVAEALKAADLEFACSANLIDNIEGLHFTPDMRRQTAALPDVTARETLKDFFINRWYRQDLFVRKGGPAMDADALLKATRFAVGVEPHMFDRIGGRTILGLVKPQPDVGKAVVTALSQKSASVNELAAHPDCAKFSPGALMETVVLLSALGAAEPVMPDAGREARKGATDRLNAILMEGAIMGTPTDCLASPVTGGGVHVRREDQLFLLARKRREEPVEFAKKVLGITPQFDARAAYAAFETDMFKVLHKLGIA